MNSLNTDNSLTRALSVLTGLLYAGLVAYLGGWFLNRWIGNFSLVLFLMSAVTGLYWVAERLYFLPRRRAAAAQLVQSTQARVAKLGASGIQADNIDIESARLEVLRQPWWLDWTAGLFPVILLVFVLRSFLFEPFRIPSGSMVPTLLVGDLILVNKYHYGVRLPVLNKKIISNHDVARGDVMVFRFPEDPRQDYIKRIVAIPGDEVAWRNQKLFINGQEVPTQDQGPFYDADSMVERALFTEKLGELEHKMLVNRGLGSYFAGEPTFPHGDQCQYSAEGIQCKVPAGHYFALGDNRDNSRDSRYWGFVPDENIVGKAVFIWMNFSAISRVGRFN
jgi:signal peptidase I